MRLKNTLSFLVFSFFCIAKLFRFTLLLNTSPQGSRCCSCIWFIWTISTIVLYWIVLTRRVVNVQEIHCINQPWECRNPQSFCEHVCNLMSSWSVKGLDHSLLYLFKNEITIDFNALRSFMKYRVCSNVKSNFIVTIE